MKVRFFKIAINGNDIFALDKNGQIWKTNMFLIDWKQIESPEQPNEELSWEQVRRDDTGSGAV